MSISPVIITFKKHPELGRLKLVADPDEQTEPCRHCALLLKDCAGLDASPRSGCEEGGYIYQPVTKEKQVKLTLNETKEIEPKFLKVMANVRYWDDGKINGEPDEDGSKTPLKVGDTWSPVIRLSDGVILDWPQGTTADLHYKVCDAGNYYLLDDEFKTIAVREDNYVPDCLAPNASGYGDYIIMNIDAAGKIEGWRGDLDESDWDAP